MTPIKGITPKNNHIEPCIYEYFYRSWRSAPENMFCYHFIHFSELLYNKIAFNLTYSLKNIPLGIPFFEKYPFSNAQEPQYS